MKKERQEPQPISEIGSLDESNLESIQQSSREIRVMYGQLAQQYPQVVLLVDIEGVLLPHGFADMQYTNGIAGRNQLSEDHPRYIGMAKHAVRVLPVNETVVNVLSELIAESANTKLMSASELDTRDIGSLPPLLDMAHEKGHKILEHIAPFHSMGDAIEEGALLLFFNDLVTDGKIPESLTAFLRTTQNSRYKSFTTLGIPIPQFRGTEHRHNTSYSVEVLENIKCVLSKKLDQQPLDTDK